MGNSLLKRAMISIVVLGSFSGLSKASQSIFDAEDVKMVTFFQDLTIAPNPFDDRFIVSYFLSADSKVVLEIYNVLGHKIYQESESAVMQRKGPHQITVLCPPQMIPGIYFLKITIPDEGSITRRIVGQ